MSINLSVASILGLDIGDVRIGIAVADSKVPFASPLTTLEASSDLVKEFKTILHTKKVTKIVIGYPRNLNGEPTKQTERVEQIVDLLKIPKSIEVVWQDESLTSVKAKDELDKRGKPYDKSDIDALAATYILDDYIKSSHSNNHVDNSTNHQKLSANSDIDGNKTKSLKKVKANKKRFKVAIGLIIALFTLTILSGVGWYLYSLSPKTTDDIYKVIKIETGESTNDIATKLQNNKLIRSSRAFTLYTRLSGINSLQAGSYRLSSSSSTPDIATTIADGKVTTTNVLVSPGLRLSQIKALLIKDGYSEDDIDEALVAVRNHPILSDYPATDPLEGYLYPNTYQIEPDTSVEQLFRTILDTFEDDITPEIKSGLQRQGLTMRQAVILASIVQKEVSDPEVQKTVAQVFIKRLNEGVVLGSDVTYKYAAAEFGTPDLPSSNSPYNTRKFLGLPPSAISNFNISALRAVAFPTSTNYNYFVAGDDGTTYFALTLEEHEQNIAKYCLKGCQ